MKTYIIGHIKPDLDSVVAAFSFAEYCKLNSYENPTPAIIDDLNPETEFVFSKFNLPAPVKITSADILPEDKVVLVDHNETDQRLVGLNPDQIVAIFDHHKVNLNLNQPIEIITLPFGSSNTICWNLFKEFKYQPSKQLAGLMLSAILSDTVGLKSSTTTDTDKQAVEDLAKIAEISSVENLTLEIFMAKSNLSTLTDEQIVLNDYKIFDFSGKKVLIGQTETVQQSEIIAVKKQNLLDAMQSVKQRESVDLIYLALTDILKVNTKLLILSDVEQQLAETAFGGKVQDNILDIGPKMSRKKDIAPLIEKSLQQ